MIKGCRTTHPKTNSPKYQLTQVVTNSPKQISQLTQVFGQLTQVFVELTQVLTIKRMFRKLIFRLVIPF